MQEEVTQKTVTFCVRATKITADLLKKVLVAYLRHQKQKSVEKKAQKNQPKQGKVTVKELAKQNAGMVNIEITDKNIKSFERYARKYGINYALKKDKSKEPPVYLVFFKGRDQDASSAVADKSVRWIVDDCIKFVKREIRRGNRYDIIIMDPPSYGRGPGGEVWKLENEVYGFVDLCKDVLSDDPLLMLINSYTTGLSPSVMQYILGSAVAKKFGGTVSSDEIGLPVKSTGMVLPCGASAIWTNKKTV